MKRITKKFFIVFVLALMLTSVTNNSVVVHAKHISYSRRANIAKKHLKKTVYKMLKSWAYKPSVKIVRSKRNGKYLTCKMQASIGGGACDGVVRVDLKTGIVTIIESNDMFPNLIIDNEDDYYDDEGVYEYEQFRIKVS